MRKLTVVLFFALVFGSVSFFGISQVKAQNILGGLVGSIPGLSAPAQEEDDTAQEAGEWLENLISEGSDVPEAFEDLGHEFSDMF